MKQFIFLIALNILTSSSIAQDLIVRDTGDSLNCKITKVKPDHIYFTFKHEDEIRSTLLPISRIILYQTDYYRVKEVPEDKVIGLENYPHFRLAINGGYSYLTSKIGEDVPGQYKEYVKGLKSGFHYGGEATYYITEPIGIGFRYYAFKTSNSIERVYYEDNNGNPENGIMSDDIYISFIGPSFSTRLLNHTKRNAFVTNLALGYMGYKNESVFVDPMKMTGNTFGMVLDIGYDIGISNNLSLGFQLSIISGNLFKYDLQYRGNTTTIELEEGEYQGLSRIDFSVGLRFSK